MNNNRTQSAKSRNRHSFAFGELQKSSPLPHSSYTSFIEAEGLLNSASSSSASSDSRRLSDDFVDSPSTPHFPTTTTANGWSHRSTSTGLRTGSQGTSSSYYQHSTARPKSADISQWSLGLPSPSSLSNGSGVGDSNHHPSTTALLSLGTPHRTPTKPVRLSAQFDSFSSPTSAHFPDSILQRSTNSLQSDDRKRPPDTNKLVDPLTEQLSQWPAFSQNQRSPHYRNGVLDHSHHSHSTTIIPPQQPFSFENGDICPPHHDLHDHRAIQAHRQINSHHHYTGQKERYHSNGVNVELMQGNKAKNKGT